MENCFGPLSLLKYFFDPYSLSLSCHALLSETIEAQHDIGLRSYLQLFMLTVAFECVPYFIGLRSSAKVSISRISRTLVIGNLLTHPFVIFILPLMGTLNEFTNATYVAVAEVFAPVAETFVIHLIAKTTLRRAAMTSFAANLISWTVGALIL